MKFNLGTFNVRGLTSEIKEEQLCTDMEYDHLDLVCLQETKIANGADKTIEQLKLLCFESRLYKTLVKSIVLYNCGTWALTSTEEERLYAYHWKQLKKILNIRYPKKIINKSLYRICREKPLSLQILSAC